MNSLEPVDPENLLDASTHGVSTVSGTLQGADNLVLFKIIDKLIHVETDFSRYEANPIDCDSVVCSDPVLEWAMISVEIVAFSDEAASKLGLFGLKEHAVSLPTLK